MIGCRLGSGFESRLVPIRARARVRVRRGGLFPHTHACKTCGLVRVASGLVESERVVKRVAPMPLASNRKQLSSAYTTPAACGFPYPTL